MNEIDSLIKDLEAGLHLQSLARGAASTSLDLEHLLDECQFKITGPGWQATTTNVLIGKDFVAWAHNSGLSVAPALAASIVALRPQLGDRDFALNSTSTRQRPEGSGVKMSRGLTLKSYLRRFSRQEPMVKVGTASSTVAGRLVAIHGELAVIIRGLAVEFISIKRIERLELPVHNFSES